MILFYFAAELGTAASESSDNSLSDNIVQISEETILTALESTQVHMYDVEYTEPITIEIGAADRPHQDNSLILGNFYIAILQIYNINF